MSEDFDMEWNMEVAAREDSNGKALSKTELYVCNIHASIKREGLMRAFAKFGIASWFFSKDPAKNYALVKFNTAQEANNALIALNNTPPLNLVVRFANRNNHSASIPPKGGRQAFGDGQRNNHQHYINRTPRQQGYNRREGVPQRELPSRNGGVSDRITLAQSNLPPLRSAPVHASKAREDCVQQYNFERDEMQGAFEDFPQRRRGGSNSSYDYDRNLPMASHAFNEEEMESYYNNYNDEEYYDYDDTYDDDNRFLTVKDLQMALRNIDREKLTRPRLETGFNSERYITPDSKVVLRNGLPPVSAGSAYDKPYNLGAKGPRSVAGGNDLPPLTGERECMSCSRLTAVLCSACGVTPYCCEGCQMNDWPRHRSVCHNLASNPSASKVIVSDSRAGDQQRERGNKGQASRAPAAYKKPVLRAGNESANSQPSRNRPYQQNKNGPLKNNVGDAACRPPMRQEWKSGPAREETSGPLKNNVGDSACRPPMKHEWKSGPAREETSDRQTVRCAESSTPKSASPPKTTYAAPSKPKITGSSGGQCKFSNAQDKQPVKETPVRKETPTSYIGDLVSVGDVLSMSVEYAAGDIVRGWMADGSRLQQFQDLCEPLAQQCEADGNTISASPGSLVCVRDTDGSWYRVRCLGGADGGSAAMLDTGRLMSLAGAQCRKVPDRFLDVAEFAFEGKSSRPLEVGTVYACTVKSNGEGGVTVAVETENGDAIGEARVARWRPSVGGEVTAPSTSSTSMAVVNDSRPPLAEEAVKETPESFVAGEAAVGDELTVLVEEAGVCLTLTEKHAALYKRVCDDIAAVCEGAETIKPAAGKLLCALNPADGGWYRARCLSDSSAALIDSGRVLQLVGVQCKAIDEQFARIPEFCCALESEADVEMGTALLCTVLSNARGMLEVTLSPLDGAGAKVKAKLSRWRPATAPPIVTHPPLERASLTPGEYVLVEVSAADVKVLQSCGAERAVVRRADRETKREYDSVMVDVAVCGAGASPLTVLPSENAVVIAQYTDGNYYRAVVRKTKHADKKYRIEYLEFGDVETTTLDRLRACPPELTPPRRRVLASYVRLDGVESDLSNAAYEYLNRFKENATTLTLSLPAGVTSAASGASVTLTVSGSKERLNAMVELLSRPAWRKLEEEGRNVTDLPVLTLDDVAYVRLPADGCELRVMTSHLENGMLIACRKDEPVLQYVTQQLPKELAAYCASKVCVDPYLPRPNELCVAKFPGRDCWCRAVVLEQPGGPGGAMLNLFCLDHAELAEVPFQDVRKMLAEFLVKPALGLIVSIRGFPEATADVIKRARTLLASDSLVASKCVEDEKGEYTIDAPAFVAALAGPR